MSANLYIKKKRRLQAKKRKFKRLTAIIAILAVLGGTTVYTFNQKNVELDNKKAVYSESFIDKSVITNKDEENKEVVENKEIIEDNKEIVQENNLLQNSGYLALKDDNYAEDAKVVEGMLRSWDYTREDGKKVAYLTFDDGPSSQVTDQILDTLKKNNVKGTFFVLASEIEKSDQAKNTLRRIVAEGHAIGNHSYSHNYDYLYPNGIVDPNNFIQDIRQAENVFKSVLGKDFTTRVVRFPGGYGSWDTSEIAPVLEAEGLVSMDWNVLNGDAEGVGIPENQLLSRLDETISDLEGNNDSIVVLMHDTDAKQSTANSLQQSIDYLKSLGYEFKSLK